MAQLDQATFACIDSLGHLALLEAARGRLRRSAGRPRGGRPRHPTRLGRLISHRHRAARPGLGFVPLGGACAGGGLPRRGRRRRSQVRRSPGEGRDRPALRPLPGRARQAGAAEALRRLRGTLAEVRGAAGPAPPRGVVRVGDTLPAGGARGSGGSAGRARPRSRPAGRGRRRGEAGARPWRRRGRARLGRRRARAARVSSSARGGVGVEGARRAGAARAAAARESLEHALQLAAPEHYRGVFLAAARPPVPPSSS